LFFILVAKLFTWWRIRSETAQVSSLCIPTAKKVQYTHLQIQAKSFDEAKYGYKEWGGSSVEDTLEVVLGFAIIACFGFFDPWLLPVAIFVNTIEYYCIAFRMVEITHRPHPSAHWGDRAWGKVLDIIGFTSAFINAGIMVYVVRGPMRRQPSDEKLMLFFIYVLGFLILRFTLQVFYPVEPPDVLQCDMANGYFIERLFQRMRLHTREAAELLNCVDQKDFFSLPKRPHQKLAWRSVVASNTVIRA